MEFIARTVTHPNTKLAKAEAVKSLKSHPEFKSGTVIIGMGIKDGYWTANLHEPKTAEAPFLKDKVEEGGPSDEPMMDDPMDEIPELDEEDSEESSDKDEPTLESIMDLVKQIADVVGVKPEGEEKDEDEELSLDDMPPMEPIDDPLPSPAPKSGPPAGGPTPVGAPAFASTKTAKPKVASFDVEEPWDGTIKEAMEAINSQYGKHGYKVKKIREDRVNDQRVIRARVSVR